MRVLISPNAFKGTMTAQEAGQIIASFLENLKIKIQPNVIPIADGGDGTCELLTQALRLERIESMTLDSIGKPLKGFYGWDSTDKKAYIDVSTASGLSILDEKSRDPRFTSSFGTGLLIQKAIENGAKEIVLGLGGSATIDLGVGILAALGISFLDHKGRLIPAFYPNFMQAVKHIQRPLKLPNLCFTCLCDVKNTFFGPHGAIPVFGEQKGLKKDDFESYEKICSDQVVMLFSKNKKNFVDENGYGAAGGVAIGLSCFFPTKIEFGSTYFFDKINFKRQVEWADLVITGEGRYDAQSKEGKACHELLKVVQKEGKKVILITTGKEAITSGFDAVLILPDLDFSVPNFKIKAKENLLRLLENNLDIFSCQTRA